MGSRYDLRPQGGDRTSSYAALPNTVGTEFVPHNPTPLKAKLLESADIQIQGCHPSRWVYELVNNNFTTCDVFRRAQFRSDNSSSWNHRHVLVINGEQSFSTTNQRVLSSVCLVCHHHFVFRMEWDEKHAEHRCNDNQSQWPLSDDKFPWHNLVWASSEKAPDTSTEEYKYYPLRFAENFACSAPPCTFQLRLEISSPRLDSSIINLLKDHDAIRQALAEAKERDPVKYKDATDNWAHEAPLNLNTYVKNLLESTPDMVRSIAKRNKRFAVVFGPRCYSIFRQLEFQETVEEMNGIDEGSFTPIAPPPATGPGNTTVIGTYRSYLEDVRAEVQCLIHKDNRAQELPTYCANILHNYLSCKEVIIGESDTALIAAANSDSYRLLGILPEQPREIVVNAYKRQWDLVPNKRKELIEALTSVAYKHQDEQLSEYAMMQSSVWDSQAAGSNNDDDESVVSDALRHFGLDTKKNHSADTIVAAFRRKVIQDLAGLEDCRAMLQVLSNASTDDVDRVQLETARDFKVYESNSYEARDILGLGSSSQGIPVSEPDAVIEACKTKVSNSKIVSQSDGADSPCSLVALPPRTRSAST
jgi:ubiquitin carboxyl-terminal hydrolase 25/28